MIATVAGMIVTYLGSRYWTFRHRDRRGGMGRETVLFLVLNGIGLGIQLASIGFTNYALGLSDKLASNVALFLGICLGTLFRFWSYRKWVWIAPPVSPALDPLSLTTTTPEKRRPEATPAEANSQVADASRQRVRTLHAGGQGFESP